MKKTVAGMSRRLGLSMVLLGFGYILGTYEAFELPSLTAQPPSFEGDDEGLKPQVDLAEETVRQIQGANEVLTQAMEALRGEGKYTAATTDLNPYLIMTGGGNAIEDLEAGAGVDPYTFASLYAGNAIGEVGDHLSYDENNRLLYKNRLVRMYSVDRLQNRQERYQAILEQRLLP